jgi:lysozyme
MPDELISNIADADLATVLSDYDFEGYAVVEKAQQPDGRWTVLARKNAANGAPQSADSDDAVQPVEEPEEPEQPQAPPAGQRPQPAGQVQQPAGRPQQPRPIGQQTLGPDGERLIKAFESCAKPVGGGGFGVYLDSVRVPTIGWGHTNHIGRQFDMNAVWTQQECDTEFFKDMRVFEAHVRRMVKVPLNQFQFDALVSFCYNCGPGNLAKSTLLKKVNGSDFPGAAQEFGKWVKAGGQTLKGLVRRRKYEARLFQGVRDMIYP